MPAKNVIKTYIENGYYHIYNRGVEKRTIFQDEQDYKTFLFYLKVYLSPIKLNPDQILPANHYDLSKELHLFAYCLMPNHFHLLVWQKNKNGMEKFIRRLGTKYAIYFNKKYQGVGVLFQGPYKAVLLDNDSQLLHLSRYIHLNPIKDSPLQRRVLNQSLVNAYSSYKNYLGLTNQDWVHPEDILSFFATARKTTFKDTHSYQNFVENYKSDPREGAEGLTLDPLD